MIIFRKRNVDERSREMDGSRSAKAAALDTPHFEYSTRRSTFRLIAAISAHREIEYQEVILQAA